MPWLYNSSNAEKGRNCGILSSPWPKYRCWRPTSALHNLTVNVKKGIQSRNSLILIHPTVRIHTPQNTIQDRVNCLKVEFCRFFFHIALAWLISLNFRAMKFDMRE